jgi:hypothetical protein
MASHPSNDNPWQDEASSTPRNEYSGSGHANPNPYSTYQDQTQSRDPYASDTSTHQGQYQPPAQQYQPPSHPPPHQQPLSSHPPDQHDPYAQDSPWQTEGNTAYTVPTPQTNTNPFLHDERDEHPPSLPPRRSATDLALPTGQDRSHQIEVMQSYEAAGRKDEHDRNVEVLQREFPGIDGSLIAAIYGDSKSLSATREMLGELEG